MKKNEIIAYSSLGLVGLFFLYYYNKNKTKKFISAVGGYGQPVGGYNCTATFSTNYCRTIPECVEAKISQIRCEIEKNDKNLYDSLVARSKRNNVPLNNILNRTAKNIFTNNGKRNNIQSLEFYKIVPTKKIDEAERLAIKEWYQNLYNSPEVLKYIIKINATPSLLNSAIAKAKSKGIPVDKQVKISALNMYKAELSRQGKRINRPPQQKQSGTPINAPVNTGSNTGSSQTYIDNYGFVPVYNLSENQFEKVTNQLFETNKDGNISGVNLDVFNRLPEGTYQVGGGGGTASATSGGGGGGGGGGECGAFGTFNYSWCQMMKNWHSNTGINSGGAGGY